MQYRSLGRCGVRVSPLCLGTMMFGGPTSEKEATQIIRQALDQGVNFIDTADIYNRGESERIVGKAIADRRGQVILATKGRQPTGAGPNDQGAGRYHLMRALEASLRRLGTDCVELYYVHTPDASTPIEETLRTLDDMVRSGKTQYVGCSNFRAWQLCEALWTSDQRNLHRLACIQPLYNIVNRDVEVELLPLCQAHGIGVVGYSPLARGILTGKYRPGGDLPPESRAARDDPRMKQAEWREASLQVAQQIAARCGEKGITASQFSLAWCLANPLVTSIIVGPRTIDQWEDNAGCLDVDISDEDERFVDGLVPPGEHSGRGFQDTLYPITGRGR